MNCKDNNYNKILNKIKKSKEDINNYLSCCGNPIYFLGPTGPTGPQGPSTIDVGITTNGLPGTQAKVTNVGDRQNTILNFTIPIGDTGPMGPTGPKGATGNIGPIGPIGLQGDTGPTGPTGPQGNTGLQGEVGPTGEQGPKGDPGIEGPTGPQGPQGVAGPPGATGYALLSAYGGRYNTDTSTLQTSGIGNWMTVPLGTTMPSINVIETTNNILSVEQDGIYEINYSINVSVDKSTSLTLIVRNNTTNIPSTVITKQVEPGITIGFNGSVITELNVGNNIDMQVSTNEENVTVTFGTGMNASLTLKKIDEVD